MSLPLDLAAFPPPVQRVVGSEAPERMKLMAARGVVPGLRPVDLAAVIAILAASGDGEVASTARATLAKLPPPVLEGALAADLDPFVIGALADANRGNFDVLEKLVRRPRIADETLAALAETADERLGEVIAVNEQRLLSSPRVIEKLYMNKRVRMSTADRLLELAVRNGLQLDIPAFKEAAAAIANELIPEPTEEPTIDDILFAEVAAEGEALDPEAQNDTFERSDEGEEIIKDRFLPLYARIAQMTVTQKVRLAILGQASERLLLVRDRNPMVAMAAVQSPMMRENEAIQISASRSVSEDVLRTIARNREFTRSYQVKHNLVSNPRTPFTFASQLVPHLRDNDLRMLSKSKNVPSAIQAAARRQLGRKQAGKN